MSTATSSASSPSNDFSSLLSQSLSLASQLPPPTIRRNVAQLQHAASKLQRTHQPQPSPSTSSPTLMSDTAVVPSASTSTSAQLFLAQQGVNLQQHASYLSSLSLSTPPTQTPSPPAGDLPTFLRLRHASILDSLVRDTIASVDDNFRRAYAATVDDEWDREKSRILDSLGFRAGKRGLASFTTPSKAGREGSASSFPSAALQSPPATASSSLSLEQQRYAEVVVSLNHKRLQHQPYPLVTALREASLSLSSSHTGRSSSLYHEVTDVFTLLRTLINERDVHNLQYQKALLTEGQYRAQYLASSPSLQRSLISQSLSYCEEVFRSHVRVSSSSLEQFVVTAVNGANAGERVRDYIGSVPVWPLVFFQLRSGDRPGGLQTVRNFAQSVNTDYGVLLSAMSQYVQDYGRGEGPLSVLPSSLQRPLQDEYNREVASRAPASIDPYKVAVYSLIGRFSPPVSIDLYAYISESVESYLWYKLSSLPSAAALTTLHREVLTQGEQHFNPDGQHPLLFFRVLLLTLRLEEAVVYLMRTQWWVVGVHAALALHYYGLIRTCDGDGPLLQGSDATSVSVAIGKIVSQFVEEMGREHTDIAFHYLYTLYPSTTALSLLSSLLTPSNLTPLLRGAGGKEGLYPHFLSPHDKRAVVLAASESWVQRGEAVDAIDLLLVGDQRTEAADLCAQHLTRVVTADTRHSRRVQLVRQAEEIERQPTPTPYTSTLSTLLSLVHFFDLYHIGGDQYDSALDVLLPLRLLPLSPRVQDLAVIPVGLQGVLAEVSVAVMDIYYTKYVGLSGEGPQGMGSAEREGMRRELRERAHALNDFTGQRSLVPWDAQAKMIRMEALMQ